MEKEAVQLVQLKAAVLGTFPGTYHHCMVFGGLGMLVELGTVLCELEV